MHTLYSVFFIIKCILGKTGIFLMLYINGDIIKNNRYFVTNVIN